MDKGDGEKAGERMGRTRVEGWKAKSKRATQQVYFPFAALLAWVTPTATPTMMAMMMTRKGQVSWETK